MKIYVITVCQNGHQERRVENFLKTQDVEVVNPERFCYKHGSALWPDRTHGNVSLQDVIDGTVEKMMLDGDDVWIILSKSFAFYSPIIEISEKKAKDLELKIRYFKINQTGRYVGRTKEVERGALLSNFSSKKV